MWLEKYRYNVFKCTRCGMCRAKYTDEVRRVCPDREHVGGFEHDFARGRIEVARGILEGALTYSRALANVLSTCTTCRNCTQQCGIVDLETGKPLVNPVEIIEAMRADIVYLGLAPETLHRHHRNPLTGDVADRLTQITTGFQLFCDKSPKSF